MFDFISKDLSSVQSDLYYIQGRWSRERSKVPFSSYVTVVEFYLRATDLDLSKIKVTSKGKSILITWKDKNEYVFEFHKDGVRTYEVKSRALTLEELQAKREAIWKKHHKKYDLEDSDHGLILELRGNSYRLEFVSERKQTYSLRCRDLSTGKLVNIRHDVPEVREALRQARSAQEIK